MMTEGRLEASWEKEERAKQECWSRGNCRGKSQRDERLRLVASPREVAGEGLGVGKQDRRQIPAPGATERLYQL